MSCHVKSCRSFLEKVVDGARIELATSALRTAPGRAVNRLIPKGYAVVNPD
jgi:hypothetical protein